MSGLIQGLLARISSTCRQLSLTQLLGRPQGDGTQGFRFLDTSQSWLRFDPRAKAQPHSCVYHEGLHPGEPKGEQEGEVAGSGFLSLPSQPQGDLALQKPH